MKKITSIDATFDRFDICEAYLTFEWDWHISGVLQERESNIRRNMSTSFQLHRMKFNPARNFNGYTSLSSNGKAIYNNLLVRYELG